MRMSEIKKLALRGLLPVLCALMLLGPLTAVGRAVSTVTAQLRPDVAIVIDGSQRVFYNAAGQQVHPISYGGTTYLPLRAIGELMGKNVDWNGETKTASLGGVRTGGAVAGTPDTAAQKQDVSVEIRDDFTILVDGTARSFADAAGGVVYPLLYQGSTYLPIRAIGQLMGKSVDWDSKTRTVTLSGSLVTDADSFSGSTGTAPSAPAGGIVSAEDAKAAALAHDLGHTPFGHAGERALSRMVEGGFRHYEQSLRVVDRLENDGWGLNLCHEVRSGILCHTRGPAADTLEGQLVRFADKIAYINHDIGDAMRGGIIYPTDIPVHISQTLGFTHGERIETLTMDIIRESAQGDVIRQSGPVAQAMQELKEFMFQSVY